MKNNQAESWNFDNVLVSFFNAVKERRNHLSKSTQTLFRRNDTLFRDELRRQAYRRSYSGRVELSEHDYDIGIYYNVVHRTLEKKQRIAAREILAPAVRALMTDKDPEGRAYLMSIGDTGLFCHILATILRAGFDDGVYAFLGAILLKHWDRLDDELDDNCWRIVGAAAAHLQFHLLAASAFIRAARLDREPERRRDSFFEASRGVCFRLREKPSDVAECCYMLDILDGCAGSLEDAPQFRVLHGLLTAWIAKLSGGDAEEAAKELFECAIRCADEWDEEHDDGKGGPLASSELAVKAPLEWQAYVATLAGDIGRQVASFPDPVYSDGDVPGFLPAASHVNGVRLWDLWEGLAPKLDDTFDAAAKRLSCGAETTVRKIDSATFQQTGPDMITDYALLQSANRADCDISVLGVLARHLERRRGKRTLEILFPFPSKDCAVNAANARGRAWEYFVWRGGIAADVRVELASGRHVCATMPFFVKDAALVVRGLSYSLFLAAFPLKMKVSSKAAGPGSLTQKCGDMHFIRSAADIVARVEAVAPASLWDGRLAYRFSLHVKDLGLDLPAFVCGEAIEGAVPAIGDTVECRAWIFADFRAPTESFAEFKKRHPKGLAVSPEPVEEPADAEGCGTFLIECHVAGTSHIEDAAGKTAELAKDSPLYLRREPGNEYDRDAIAIYTAEENRIGYVPQKHNPILSRLMDGGRELVGRVVSREVVDDLLRMQIGIYLR